VIKSSNLKRHYDTKHKEFEKNYPKKSEIRMIKIESLKTAYNHSTKVLLNTTTEQENSTEASFKIAWILGKKMLPFTHAEVVKECLVEAASTLLGDDKKNLDLFKNIPLSSDSCTRRIQILSENVFDQLKKELSLAEYFSLAVDESTDITDTAQLSVFIRFFNGKNFVEDLLGLIPLHGQTRGEDIFNALLQFLNNNCVNINALISVATDGAPAMKSDNKGLIGRLRNVIPHLISYHCIIHRHILCSNLNNDFKQVMDLITKLVNFLRCKSALKHRELKDFLEKADSQYGDLLLYNNVRWLSKGNVLNRVWELRSTILKFLMQTQKGENEFIKFFNDKIYMIKFAFLVDIFGHLNQLNTVLQGENKIIPELCEAVYAFNRKIELFISDVENNEFLHFQALKEYIETIPKTTFNWTIFIDFLKVLKSEITGRVDEFQDKQDVMKLIKHPFSISPTSEWSKSVSKWFPNVDRAKLQLEMCDFKNDSNVEHFKSFTNPLDYWCALHVQNNFPTVTNIVIKMCTMFGSTWLCESSFSNMNFIKNKFRSTITNEHLGQCLRIARTPYSPQYKKIIKGKKCHFSH
jgi:hypothetical protein